MLHVTNCHNKIFEPMKISDCVGISPLCMISNHIDDMNLHKPYLKIQVFWNVTLWQWECSLRRNLHLLSSKNEGTLFLSNKRNHSPSDTVLHPRRHESSAIPLWEPHILPAVLGKTLIVVRIWHLELTEICQFLAEIIYSYRGASCYP